MSGTGASEQAGRQFGAAVNAIGINDATHAVLDAYTQTGAPYTHQRPAHEPMQHFAGGKWGGANALLVPVIGAFPPPPGRTSPATVVGHPSHKADFAAVATKGIDTRAAGTRTLHEEITGIFWGYDGPPELGTPPRLYMQVVLTILDNLQASNPGGLSPAEELRVIAGIGIAMADAAISAWYYKYSPQHMMWRPVVGIQKAPGNNGTAIPGWLPLGRPDTNGMGQWLTPDFPAYPSGHATFGGAAFQLLRLFLVQKGLATFKPNGTDDIDFDFVSDEYSGRNLDPRTMAPRPHMSRHYDSLWDAIVDNSISRVFLGVHWYFDGITTRSGSDDVFGAPAAPNKLGQTGGVWLGGQIANQIAPMIGISQATIIKSKMT